MKLVPYIPKMKPGKPKGKIIFAKNSLNLASLNLASFDRSLRTAL